MSTENTETINTSAPVENTPAAAPQVIVNVDHAEMERLKGANEALQAEIASLKSSAASEPAALDAKVSARLALHERARVVLGSVDLAGKTDREVMALAVEKADGGFKADGKSDDYLAGRFDTVVERFAASAASAAKVHADSSAAANVDTDKNPIHEAQIKHLERALTAWKGNK